MPHSVLDSTLELLNGYTVYQATLAIVDVYTPGTMFYDRSDGVQSIEPKVVGVHVTDKQPQP